MLVVLTVGMKGASMFGEGRQYILRAQTVKGTRRISKVQQADKAGTRGGGPGGYMYATGQTGPGGGGVLRWGDGLVPLLV